jgi:glutamate-ammonia-ligase adenylyltransferase
LLEIAAHDLASEHPETILPEVSQALADLATAALETALAIARAEVADANTARLAVIAMGKTGGRELNYISDVDVIYVYEPADGVAEELALKVATDLATVLGRVCSTASAEPALWQVDPNLRPEGRDGPLVRTLASHQAYYERWAKTWEFQALLKARVAAGDQTLGEAYCAMTRPMVWSCVERPGFVADAQAMRRRVESNVPAEQAERQIKLGRGGLRDVEFTVQLLQLVHGRADPSIQSAGTLDALSALAAGGYVGRQAADSLDGCYRWLRVLEHRVQLHRLKRSHLLPTSPPDLRRLGRVARIDPPERLDELWRSTRRQVRALHQEVFYRPLLPQMASLTADEAVLAPDAARHRLTALGYLDPAGALRHIAALTSGVSRRSAIARQLLPVMLGFFADGADPDSGLLSFRRISEELGATPWYMRMLRDAAGAAERLAHVLAGSRYVSDGLLAQPDSVLWFGSDQQLQPPAASELAGEIEALVGRQVAPEGAIRQIRAVRRRELVRLGAHLLTVGAPTAAGQAGSGSGAAGSAQAGSGGGGDTAQAGSGGGGDTAQAGSGGGGDTAQAGSGGGGDTAQAGSGGGGDAAQAGSGRGGGPGQANDNLPVYYAVSQLTDVVLRGALQITLEGALAGKIPGLSGFDEAPSDLAIIAMGSLGGQELSLASDADVLFVHRPRPGVDPVAAQAWAVGLAGQLRTWLNQPGPEPPLVVDADLRPEGRLAPLVRSLDAYRQYYARWALPWERQALLRARPVAGTPELLADFIALADQVRYLSHGLTEAELVELRRIKARVEAERLPRGVEPARHLKLGPGGLADVQWIAQLLTLRLAGKQPTMRLTGTVAALNEATALGVLAGEDRDCLVDAWHLAMSLRDANLLWTGRVSASLDVLPHDRRALEGLARILGYGPGGAAELEDAQQRHARRARAVFERLFYQ